jgi:hypothetical protein
MNLWHCSDYAAWKQNRSLPRNTQLSRSSPERQNKMAGHPNSRIPPNLQSAKAGAWVWCGAVCSFVENQGRPANTQRPQIVDISDHLISMNENGAFVVCFCFGIIVRQGLATGRITELRQPFGW